MARKPCNFKQQDVTRVLRATVAAGMDVQRIEVDKDGKIVVVTVTGRPADGQASNEWDEIDGEDQTKARQ